MELSPDNALVRYQRAKILIGMRRYKVSEIAIERSMSRTELGTDITNFKLIDFLGGC